LHHVKSAYPLQFHTIRSPLTRDGESCHDHDKLTP
jgi:hypothetical protein